METDEKGVEGAISVGSFHVTEKEEEPSLPASVFHTHDLPIQAPNSTIHASDLSIHTPISTIHTSDLSIHTPISTIHTSDLSIHIPTESSFNTSDLSNLPPEPIKHFSPIIISEDLSLLPDEETVLSALLHGTDTGQEDMEMDSFDYSLEQLPTRKDLCTDQLRTPLSESTREKLLSDIKALFATYISPNAKRIQNLPRDYHEAGRIQRSEHQMRDYWAPLLQALWGNLSDFIGDLLSLPDVAPLIKQCIEIEGEQRFEKLLQDLAQHYQRESPILLKSFIDSSHKYRVMTNRLSKETRPSAESRVLSGNCKSSFDRVPREFMEATEFRQRIIAHVTEAGGGFKIGQWYNLKKLCLESDTAAFGWIKEHQAPGTHIVTLYLLHFVKEMTPERKADLKALLQKNPDIEDDEETWQQFCKDNPRWNELDPFFPRTWFYRDIKRKYIRKANLKIQGVPVRLFLPLPKAQLAVRQKQIPNDTPLEELLKRIFHDDGYPVGEPYLTSTVAQQLHAALGENSVSNEGSSQSSTQSEVLTPQPDISTEDGEDTEFLTSLYAGVYINPLHGLLYLTNQAIRSKLLKHPDEKMFCFRYGIWVDGATCLKRPLVVVLVYVLRERELFINSDKIWQDHARFYPVAISFMHETIASVETLMNRVGEHVAKVHSIQFEGKTFDFKFRIITGDNSALEKATGNKVGGHFRCCFCSASFKDPVRLFRHVYSSSCSTKSLFSNAVTVLNNRDSPGELEKIGLRTFPHIIAPSLDRLANVSLEAWKDVIIGVDSLHNAKGHSLTALDLMITLGYLDRKRFTVQLNTHLHRDRLSEIDGAHLRLLVLQWTEIVQPCLTCSPHIATLIRNFFSNWLEVC